MALGLTQIITAMSTSTTFGWLTILSPSCADCLEIWEPQPPKTLWPCKRPVMELIYFFYTAWRHFHIFMDYISTRKTVVKKL